MSNKIYETRHQIFSKNEIFWFLPKLRGLNKCVCVWPVSEQQHFFFFKVHQRNSYQTWISNNQSDQITAREVSFAYPLSLLLSINR